MRISGTEPSSVILSQKGSKSKGWKVMSQKCQKQAEAERDVTFSNELIGQFYVFRVYASSYKMNTGKTIMFYMFKDVTCRTSSTKMLKTQIHRSFSMSPMSIENSNNSM